MAADAHDLYYETRHGDALALDVRNIHMVIMNGGVEKMHWCRGAQAPQRPIINYSVEQYTWYPRIHHRLQSARQAVGIGPRPL